jgi:hypothetical protein
MSDYFDHFELALTDAVARRAHLRWYTRWTLPLRSHSGLAIVIAFLAIATPAVAAVGAASGWFSTGKPDVFYPASAAAGLGKTIRGTGMLPIRVGDPDGGPAWGMRLVKTDRGDTCVQVGRVEHGEIGTLGIDYSWGNDHKFHPIKANDEADDICGATDAAGHGFVSSTMYGQPASAFSPSDYGTGTAASYCLLTPRTAKPRVPACPPGSLRTIFVGLLGPDAKSITYKTPSGATRSEDTVGGVGAYLIVFKRTADYCQKLLDGTYGCANNYGGTDSPVLRAPNAVTSVTYISGRTCRDEPPPSLAAAYKKFVAMLRNDRTDETPKQASARVAKFLAAHHLTTRNWLQALRPQCAPVGWVAAKLTHVTTADVAAPLKVTISEGRRFCSKGPWSSVQDDTITCDRGIPPGDRSYWESPLRQNGPLFALIRVSFTAREPVTTSTSFYEWNIQEPGNNGDEGNRTQANVRSGETVTFTMSEAIPGTGADAGDAIRGVYHATIGFEPNVGQAGPETGGGDPGHDGSVRVGTFSFRLPPNG